MKTIHKHLIVVPLLFQAVCMAQTVNVGELYVSPNTQFSTVSRFDNTPTGAFVNDGEAFIYSHFNNDGSVDFTPGEQGYIRFEGTAVQQLSGGNISYFYDVLFDNASSGVASFELSSEISIDNEADFTRGIVKDDDFGGLVVFENDATHVNVDDGSHVDGLVQKNGDKAFDYPIGDKQFFRYAAISAPDDGGDVFTGKYFYENPNPNYPLANNTGVIELIDDQEYWTITRDAGNSTVMLTLSWEEGTTTPAAIVAQPQSAIHIVRWDEVQQQWVDEGGTVDAANKTVTTVIALDDYGVFTLARVKEDLILPGNVVVYNGVTPNGDGLNDYFIIDNIQDLANNKVEIFNRSGVKVFETEDYDTNSNVFNGYSEGRLTLNGDNQLPTGTYFYILTYDYSANGSTERVKQAGYLYLTTGK
ncbi:gliding motility-associated C-terminal domain-containing protein [Galbibacter sp. EGI 63066]|uniref:gliding motility-associated C-terminal domain-containing protein n=1 Tax=Galbibacter sp. EGI 63066 TaxID=2993559 RepID=UPI00224889D9|nr:gliding motility-associated C-terminal domain-containing protein [Galbibacter sp. EGI 63066]MCX2679832.1 gliding motility-associated C-terminal domain-containing protein [Galbibacter sp. EGI 63066]